MIHLEDPDQEQQEQGQQEQQQQQEQEQQQQKEQSSDQKVTIVTSQPQDEKKEEENVIAPFAPEVFESEKSWLCCTSYKDKSNFKNIIQHLDLTTVQKGIIETRYLHILQNLQKRARNHGIIHFIGHFVITVGSLLVPALLSIQNSDREFALTSGPFNVHIYWATFAISLLVTMWNAILTLFRIDKKYFFLNTILERLRSEGWQYVSLTGRYSGFLTKGMKPTHKNQFIHFTHNIERVKMKQIEEEYYRTDEKSQAPTTGSTTTSSSVPPSVPGSAPSPSPAGSITGMSSSAIPHDIAMARDGLRQSQTQSSLYSTMFQVPQVYDPSAPYSMSQGGYGQSVLSMNVPYVQSSSNPIYYGRVAPITDPSSTNASASATVPTSTPSVAVPTSTIVRERSRSPPLSARLAKAVNDTDPKQYPARFRDMRKKYDAPTPISGTEI